MFIKLCRKHPQGIPFTRIVLFTCRECGAHEMNMAQSPSRDNNDSNNDMRVDPVGGICWECIFNY